jgi:transposase
MIKNDGRKLNAQQQLEMRKQAFELIRGGLTNREVAKQLGIHEVTVSVWKKKGLKISQKGLKKGQTKTINKINELDIYTLLCDSNPTQTDSCLPFWTKKSILKLIDTKYNKNIPSSTLGDYLKAWNLNSDSVIQFKTNFIKEINEETYENIKSTAKNRHAIIWWIQILKNTVPIGSQKSGNENYHFIINDNQGLLMICIYSSPDLIHNFHNFLLKTEQASKKLFLIVNGVTGNQYNILNNYIKDNYENHILDFMSLCT